MSADDDSRPNALTELVKRARSGRRSDVQALLSALPSVRFLLPITSGVPAVPVGQRVELNQAVELLPHYLPDGRGHRALPLFTYFGPLDRLMPVLDWHTDGGPLQLFTLPGPAAFTLAYKVVDAWKVTALVVDAGAPSELQLTRGEIRSILDGQALPLDAYTRVAEQAASSQVELEPVPAGLVRAVESCLRGFPEVREHRLARIYDPERHTHPRLVLTLWAQDSPYRAALVSAITKAVQTELPPPGELELRFES
jgi:hypothetical protein